MSGPGSKITDDDARAIRERVDAARQARNARGLGKQIAKEYGISTGAVSMIIRGRTYQNAGGPLQEGSGGYNPCFKINDDEAREIREYRAGGFSIDDLAKMYEISRSAVRSILKGITHKDAGGPLDTGPRRNRRPVL